MRAYREGSITVSTTSNIVVGIGTKFVANVAIGDIILLESGVGLEIIEVTDDTTLKVDINPPSAGTGVPYVALRFVTPLQYRNLSLKIEQFLTDRQISLKEFADWATGTMTGGPNGDGRYPLTDRFGKVTLAICPAVLDVLSGSNIGALNDLVGAADKGIVFTGPDELAVFDLTAKGRELLGKTDEAAMRTFLSLQNVDNTSDANKPVSKAQKDALDLKADKETVNTALNLKADKVITQDKGSLYAINPIVGWKDIGPAAVSGDIMPAITTENATFRDEGTSAAGWSATDMSMTVRESILRATKTNAAGAGAQITRPVTLPANGKDYILYVKMRSNTGCVCWLNNTPGDRLAILWLNAISSGTPSSGSLSITGYKADGTTQVLTFAEGVDTTKWVEMALHYDSKFATLTIYQRKQNGGLEYKGRVACDHNSLNNITFRTLSNAPLNSWIEFDYVQVSAPNIVVVGDSIAEGKPGFSPNMSLGLNNYLTTWMNYAKLFTGLRNNLIVSKGVGGNSSAAIKDRASDYADIGAKLVFLHASSNDTVASISQAARTANIQASVDAVKNSGASLVLLNAMYGTSGNSMQPALRDYMNQWWTVGRLGLTGVDAAIDIMEPLRSPDNFMKSELTSPDGIHWLPAGARAVGDWIYGSCESGLLLTSERAKLQTVEHGAQVNPDLISQPEAEAGTNTTTRTWSAQRVFQAITAWWNASAAKTKLDSVQQNAQVNHAAGTQAEAEGGGADLRSWSSARLWQAAAAWWTASQAKAKLDGIETNAQKNPDAVSQAEAEQGAITLARAWSPVRVHQAITGWANARLGTASGKNVTISNRDTTPDRVLKVGDFGLGVTASLSYTNLDLVKDPGFYYCNNPVNGPSTSNGFLLVESANGSYYKQTYTNVGSGPDIYVRQIFNGTPLPWVKMTRKNEVLSATGGTIGAVNRIFFDAPGLTDAELSTNLSYVGAIEIREVNQVAQGKSGADNYSPSISFHYGGYAVNRLWMNASGVLRFGASKVLLDTDIEYGGNANGNYVRFPDGMQICYFQKSNTTIIENAYVGGYRSTGLNASYPASFVGSPVVATADGALNSSFGVAVVSASTTGITFVHVAPTVQASAARVANFIAIGRWK